MSEMQGIIRTNANFENEINNDEGGEDRDKRSYKQAEQTKMYFQELFMKKS